MIPGRSPFRRSPARPILAAANPPNVLRSAINTSYNTSSLQSYVTMPAAATAGNLILGYCSPDKSVTSITTPAGFTPVPGASHLAGGGVSGALFYKIATGGESVFLFEYVSGTTRFVTSVALEIENVNQSDPIDQIAMTNGNAATARSITVGPTDNTSQANELALAFWSNDSAQSFGGSPNATNIGWSDGFTEVTNFGANPLVTVGAGAPGLHVASKPLPTIGAVQSTFSYSGGTADESLAFLVTLRAAA